MRQRVNWREGSFELQFLLSHGDKNPSPAWLLNEVTAYLDHDIAKAMASCYVTPSRFNGKVL